MGEPKSLRITIFPGGEGHNTRDMCLPGGGTHNTIDILIGTWYRPTTSSTEIFSHFETLISKLDSENAEFYLMISTVTLLCVKPITIPCYFLIYRMSTVFINLSTS